MVLRFACIARRLSRFTIAYPYDFYSAVARTKLIYLGMPYFVVGVLHAMPSQSGDKAAIEIADEGITLLEMAQRNLFEPL